METNDADPADSWEPEAGMSDGLDSDNESFKTVELKTPRRPG